MGDSLLRNGSSASQEERSIVAVSWADGKAQKLSHSELIGSAGLLQQCDLARMIELVLRHALKHVVVVVPVRLVFLSRDLLRQAFVREGFHGLDQFVVNLLCAFESAAPGSLASVHDRREVLLIGKIHGLAGETAANRTIPRCDVQNQFPDAVSVFEGTCGSLRGSDTVENFKQRVAMPGVSMKGAAELIGDAGGFGHGGFLIHRIYWNFTEEVSGHAAQVSNRDSSRH